MSACDTCRAPGSCCRGMAIFSAEWHGEVSAANWREEAAAQLDAHIPGHPFIPAFFVPYESSDTGTVRWDCKNLDAAGRCADYENRPDLCRSYQAGHDALCAEYVQQLRGIPITVKRTAHNQEAKI